MLSALSFETIQEKREYVRTILIDRGKWNPTLEGETTLPHVPEDVREGAEASTVLQPGLSKKGMGSRQEKHRSVPHMPNPVRPKTAATNILQSKVPVGSVAQSKSGKPTRPVKERRCRMLFANIRNATREPLVLRQGLQGGDG
jgi:hypothetical protein